MGAISRRQHIRSVLLALALSVETVMADPQPSFVWGFNTFKGTSLPECARLQIFVGTSGPGLNTASQPPYTLIAYEASGITTTQLVGSDLTNLFWTVDHAAGSQLVLSMADAAGNSGGVGEELFTVTAGTTTSCHAQNPTSPVTITTNTTKTISSCDILPIKVSGGTKPYTFTVAALGSVTVTNFTLGPQFDTYNWVNRASPSTQLLASVSDANGIYAASTNLLTTSGSTDLTCGGRESTEIDSTGQASAVQSGTAAVTATSTANSTNSSSSSGGSKSSTPMAPILGGVIGGVVLIGALVMGALFFLRRRKLSARGPRPYASDDPYNGFGLGKVGGPQPGQNVNYTNIPPHAEEITPFVMAGGQRIPYSDQSPYQNTTYSSNYSSAASETTLGPAVQPRPSSYYDAQNLPPGTPYTVSQSVAPSTSAYSAPQNSTQGLSPYSVPPTAAPGPSAYSAPQHLSSNVPSSASVSSFDPYGAYDGVVATAAALPASPTEYSSASGTQPMYGGPVMGSEARSVRTGEAGPSMTRFAVANPSAEPEVLSEKQGPVPPEPRRESVYQHEDISDVVELPPAYKERTQEE